MQIVAAGAGVGLDEVVAIYLEDWWKDETSALLHTSYHDVPWDDPGVRNYYALR